MYILFLLHVSFRRNELEKWRIVCKENKLWEKLGVNVCRRELHKIKAPTRGTPKISSTRNHLRI